MPHHGESQPPELAEQPFQDVQHQLDHFVNNTAEVATLFDYRNGGKRVIRQKLAQLFAANEMAWEPVVISPTFGVSRLVDYSTNRSEMLEGDVEGYFAGFYPVPDVLPPDAANEQSPDDVWQDDTNTIIVQLGIRLKPTMPLPGYNMDHTYIEVLATNVESVLPVEEQHPLMVEDEIFNTTSNHVLRYGPDLGLKPDTLAKRLSDLTKRQTEECQFTGCEMVLDLYPRSHFFRVGDLELARSSESPLEVGVILARKPMRVKLLGFDWLWDDEPVHDGTDSASLFAALELLDEEDITELGSRVISTTADSIQIGRPIEYSTLIDTDANIFAYENMYQDALVDLDNLGLNKPEVDEAIYNVLSALHGTCSPKVGTKAPVSHTLGATVVINTDVARVLQTTTARETELLNESVTVQEYQDICGTVAGFRVVETKDHQPRFLVVCVLDVCNDRYFEAINVQQLEVPITCIAKSKVLTRPDIPEGLGGLVNHSLDVHAN